ncbi:MAG: protein kinase, partial [Lachnospiraceae bacterium]|nr:protein kinase [Lachnospiraceae bacterium]
MSRVESGEVCPSCGLTQGAYQPASHHLPPGTVLAGRYLLGRVLGEGGFGITYIGRDLRLEMKVAVKEYFPVDRVYRKASKSMSVTRYSTGHTTDYEKGLKKFLYEARTLARMEKQPEIVTMRDYFEANGTAYIVMEYVDGITFTELVKERGGRIPPEELFDLLEPLFGALGAVHRQGVLHRDISPDNLMLEKGKVRLIDFGCAREVTVGTETITIALKQGYGPIEQYQGKGQGPWTDVYALSATICYCLSGRKPPQALDRLLNDELVWPGELGINITPKQEKALKKGMAVNPEKRYRCVEELYAGLYDAESEPESETMLRAESELKPEVISGEKPESKPEDMPDAEPGSKPAVMPGEEPESKPGAIPGAEPGSKPGVMPGAEPESKSESVLIQEPVPEQDFSDTPSAPAGKRRGLRAGIICAALAVIAALGIYFGSDIGGAADTDDSTTVAEADTAGENTENTEDNGLTESDIDILFADAVTLSSGSEEELRKLMKSAEVPAVILADADLTVLDGEIEVTKPLLVEEGVELENCHPVTVSGEGIVCLKGRMTGIGVIRTSGGGSVWVGNGGVLDCGSALWLETEDDLT